MQATSNSATFDDDGTTSHDNEHDASPSKLSSDKQRTDDYSSSLKFLLSGIIKRNHLSVDDALINDCRSVAERGQHSLRTETRDAIDSYGDEVERCMDWVANGPVPLGVFDASNESDGISREQVMQRQLDELEKRYTLVKRMKQNMGHTALMLSGGGGE
jgi:phage gp36-like protein